MNFNIAGIQQVGIGLKDLQQAQQWYAQYLGMDLPMFEDEAEALLMSRYTGGTIYKRKAALMMNLRGGGGFELWQFTNRTPAAFHGEVQEGMLGISSLHMRCESVSEAHALFSKLNEVSSLSEIKQDGLGRHFFQFIDPFQNWIKVIEDDYQFIPQKSIIGGVLGVTIGVSDFKKSVDFYTQIFDFEVVGSFEKGEQSHGWLKPKKVRQTAFGALLGPIVIELVHSPSFSNQSIYKNRFWGDLGLIHLCLDVQHMDSLKQNALNHGIDFKVDSENSYDMGEAAGRFAYIEDPDGTLIELVETFKVPIVKKLNWYLVLNEKKKFKALPKFIFKILSLNRLKT